jgi:hypothetical protein
MWMSNPGDRITRLFSSMRTDFYITSTTQVTDHVCMQYDELSDRQGGGLYITLFVRIPKQRHLHSKLNTSYFVLSWRPTRIADS